MASIGCKEHVHGGFNPTFTIQGKLYIIEFHNTLCPSVMPPHTLQLKKKHSIIMLLRNLDPVNGHRNGTRHVIDMGGRLPAVAGMPANRTFLELSAGQSDWPEKSVWFCHQESAGDLFRFATKKSDFSYGQPLVSA